MALSSVLFSFLLSFFSRFFICSSYSLCLMCVALYRLVPFQSYHLLCPRDLLCPREKSFGKNARHENRTPAASTARASRALLSLASCIRLGIKRLGIILQYSWFRSITIRSESGSSSLEKVIELASCSIKFRTITVTDRSLCSAALLHCCDDTVLLNTPTSQIVSTTVSE